MRGLMESHRNFSTIFFSLNTVKTLYIAKTNKGSTDTNIAKGFSFFFFKILVLTNLYTQHGA